MKRMLQFKKTDAGYACFENDENVFEIAKSNLQFDVRAFYQAFYSEDKDSWGVTVIGEGVTVGAGNRIPPKAMVDTDIPPVEEKEEEVQR